MFTTHIFYTTLLLFYYFFISFNFKLTLYYIYLFLNRSHQELYTTIRVVKISFSKMKREKETVLTCEYSLKMITFS